MSIKLVREKHQLLNKLAKRINSERFIWYNCSLNPIKGGIWNCYICEKDFTFKESFLEVDEHGQQHLKDSNLLPFI